MSVSIILNRFGKRVVKESRTALTKKKKNASKRLYNSIGYDLEVHKNSFHLSFKMEDYGKFIDRGVKGVGGTKTDGSQWKRKKVTNNAFRFRDKRPPTNVFNGWTIKRGIAPRSKGGQFQKRKSILFALAETVYRTGIETTDFFTKPFESAFRDLPNDIIEAYSLEIDTLLK